MTTNQGESQTCTVHALTKAARQSLAEQNRVIDLNNCLASLLKDPSVDEEEGNFPDEFHGAKISSVDQERLKWPGSVELSVKSLLPGGTGEQKYLHIQGHQAGFGVQ